MPCMSAPPVAPEPMRAVEPGSLSRAEVYGLLNTIVVPRPIAWVSSIDEHGRHNLAPHSYMTVAGVVPPTLLFVSVGDKDTVRNVRATRNFVVNTVDRRLASQMNVSAADAPPGVSEFDLAHLVPVPSTKVAAPRVQGAPVSIECELDRIEPVGSEPSYVILGRALVFHIAERLFDGERMRVDPAELDAIARMGGALYSSTTDRFSMLRPTYEAVAQQASADEGAAR